MNKRQYSYVLRNEIAKLNKRIDSKIALGYAYARDARRHKQLLLSMKRVSQKKRGLGLFRFGSRLGFTLF